ncbi:2-keto-4-pentenoate hydratase/2-oxohepta-3-ene-1,7-dioic acid hydratase (catechol pathway) [Pseudooceanicola antarcticus]|uniref:2-keto-4-pentenoate hydratase/2-oxohepta-3-ene-1,7-dioic acid hydratase (Catechol pathway) n=1 Tax=Pseudooceanicola antarcticus TaxID=1247613 RepID=A0A285IJ45_9RHOB|nr:fumarylacetoacetate hydrolase family protein [Pseudooceanicola antarcticus]SNY47992.1 2-keto-4-pentenoate hydratase/2-oxohepta-3-ene-1,7-dioic acid hydratase (catechol pathway) [Pseudooceanicola antarcticus]
MRTSFLIPAALVTSLYAATLYLLALPDWNFERPDTARVTDQTLADPNEALTFAFSGNAGTSTEDRQLLLVTSVSPAQATAIDLAPHLPSGQHDAFDAINILGWEALVRLGATGQSEVYPFDALLPVSDAQAHVAFGTNFASHGEEVANETPFAFPRLLQPSAPTSELAVDTRTALMDYEVELCMSFDRDIASLTEFDSARKAVFLCGDFTDRAAMLRGMPDGEDTFSGIGFTDAKSLPGAFPTGPLLVIPQDWRSFVASEAIATELDGRSMQFTEGSDMLMDFRQMVGFALEHGNQDNWTYQGAAVPLARDGVIRRGQVVLSGTADGVLFRPPSRRTMAAHIGGYLLLGGFLSGDTPRRYIIEQFIENGIDEKAMLQPGDTVVHRATRLGTIKTTVVSRANAQ